MKGRCTLKAKTFTELEVAENVTAQELRATLRDYADGGWAIKGRTVVGIINRTPLGRYDLADLLASAEIGVRAHNRMQEPGEVAEYQEVVDRIRHIISHTDMNPVRVLSSAFKPGKFKNVVFLWIGLCLAGMAIGKLLNSTIFLFLVPGSITVFFVIILAMVYSVVKETPVA